MFLNDKEKESRKGVLKSLLGKLGEVDSQKFKKPVAAEISVTEMNPKSSLMDEMGKAGHDGVEEAEEQLFPAEEAKEEAMEGGEEEGGEAPSEEELMLLRKLAAKYL